MKHFFALFALVIVSVFMGCQSGGHRGNYCHVTANRQEEVCVIDGKKVRRANPFASHGRHLSRDY